MEIHSFRVVIRAADFDRSCQFYGEVLSLPRVQSWERENRRGALYQAGPGVIEIQGRPRAKRGAPSGERDEAFSYQGPEHKMTVTLVVPSAEKAYERLIFRDKNIPGGLRREPDGILVFETHDPDGVKIVCRGDEN